MSMTTCPHCSALVEPGAYCEACGMALPSAIPSTPRVVAAADSPTTSAGTTLVAEELRKSTRSAAGALLTVAILQTLFGPVLVWAMKEKLSAENPGMDYELQPIGLAVVLGIAAIFWGLYFWARRSPLPAAIVGLVVYVSVILLDAAADPTTLSNGWLVRGIIIYVLAKAISAGIKHRRIMERVGVAVTPG